MDILENSQVVDALPPEWRLLSQAIRSRFLTGDFDTGVRFIAAVAEAADAADHHPDIDLRYLHADFALISHSAGGLTQRDLSMAAEISRIAAELHIRSAPEQLAEIEVALDTGRSSAIAPFWAAIFGGDIGSDESNGIDEVVAESTGQLPHLWFQRSEDTDAASQRFHLDIWVPAEVAEDRISRAVKAGGRVVDRSHEPSFTVLEDKDGNKACICTSRGR